MQRGSEPGSEHSTYCSEHIVLECRCGERLVLLGHEDDWYAEGRTVFECGCGRNLTLAERLYNDKDSGEGLDEEALAVRELLRGLGLPGNGR